MVEPISVLVNNAVQSELCTALEERGIKACSVKAGQRSPIESERIILPFPTREDKLDFLPEEERMAEYFLTCRVVYGGMFSEKIKNAFEKDNIKCVDYFKDEAYVLRNAQLTSQGAVRLLLDNTSMALIGKRVLISGFGRIGKALSKMLLGLGMKVFVAVRRSSSIAEAELLGYEALHISQLKSTIFYFDYIFNTVPFNIFDCRDVMRIKDSALYFELASSPYGAEAELFESHSKRRIDASSLPGRFFPRGVAENIAAFVLSQEVK